MSTYLPTSDAIARRYTASTLDQKIQNKTALQEEFGWPAEPKRPMVCLPAGMTDALGGKLLEEVLPGILALDLQILILGKGSAAYGTVFTKLENERKHRIHIMPDEEAAHLAMYAAADISLFLADPASLKELTHCLTFGVVPIAPASKALEEYDPIQENGFAFIYEPTNVWTCYGAVVRALETYRFPFDWRTIQRHCMESIRTK
ncbi:MAG: hypothetical protein Q7R81_04135 [Candidatus Peregrinibacteria bacterium]|nr:hypothetical protein [Candidatus Peregrinibacteria bacterium]